GGGRGEGRPADELASLHSGPPSENPAVANPPAPNGLGAARRIGYTFRAPIVRFSRHILRAARKSLFVTRDTRATPLTRALRRTGRLWTNTRSATSPPACAGATR